KGNQAAKESIDRISGSGVFARDPDSILVMTQHETKDAFTIDATLRNLKPLEPFCVRWQFPLMRRDEKLDPKKLKQIGRPKIHTVEKILAFLKGQKLTSEKWWKKVSLKSGIPRSTFYALLQEAETLGQVKKTKRGQWFCEVPPTDQAKSGN